MIWNVIRWGSFFPKLDFPMLMNFYRGSRGKTYNDTFSYPVNGCAEIINSLVANLDKNKIHLNETVERIDTSLTRECIQQMLNMSMNTSLIPVR